MASLIIHSLPMLAEYKRLKYIIHDLEEHIQILTRNNGKLLEQFELKLFTVVWVLFILMASLYWVFPQSLGVFVLLIYHIWELYNKCRVDT